MTKIFKYLIITVFLILIMSLVYPIGYFVLNDKNLVVDHSKVHEGIVSYIINLDRSSQRFKYVSPKVKRLGYPTQKISGIDGVLLTDDEIHQKVDFKAYQNFLNHVPKRGTIGCSLSHIKAWQTFLNSNYEFAIIFEDDVDFDSDKLKQSLNELIIAKNYWDINSFEISHKGMPIEIKQFKNDRNLVVYLTEVTHAGAYIISRKAAKKLLEYAMPIKMPIDHYFTRAWEFDLIFTGVEPRLVHQKFGDSEIAITKIANNVVMSRNLLDHVRFGIFKFQSYAIRFFYNLKIYIMMNYLKPDDLIYE